MAPTRIELSKNKHGRGVVTSVHLSTPVYEAAVRSAELLGYQNMSAFLKDAICDKIEMTASAMSAVARQSKVISDVSF